MVHYEEHAPPIELAPIADCFWSLRADPGPDAGAVERVIPDGCAEIIVQLGDRFVEVAASGGDGTLQPRAFVVGPLSRGLALRPLGRVLTFGIRIRPQAIGRVLGDAAHRFQDRVEPIDSVFGRRGLDLATALGSARDDAARFVAATDFLKTVLAAMPRRDRRVDAAVRALVGAGGLLRVEDLAAQTGIGRRSLERSFRDEVGVTPKTLARIVRFRALIDDLRSRPERGFASLALHRGYYDQAHLVRDFRVFAGRTPREFAHDEGILSACFAPSSRL